MPYPQFRAGQRVTAALLNAGKLEYVTNASGAQTNSTTTMAAATDLVFDVEANARYKVHALISYDANNGAGVTQDAKFDWTIPTGATMARNVIGLATSATSNLDSNVEMIRRGATTDQVAGGVAGTASSFCVYEEVVDLITSSTAGTAQFNFAANGAGTATLQADSVIYYQRVA